MRVKTPQIITSLWICGLISLLGFGDDRGVRDESVANNAVPGMISLSSSSNRVDKKIEKKPKPYDVVKNLPDDALFLKVGEDDVLKWGDVRTYVDAVVGVQLVSLFGVAAKGTAEMNEIQFGLYGSTLTKLVRGYIMTSLVAQEAKKEGLQISEKDIKTNLETFRKRSKRLFSFQYQFVTNLVYQRAYIDKHIRPNVKVTDEEIAMVIKWRHDSNLSVPLTNAIFRAKIEDLRKQIVAGTLDFSEAAGKYSECTECCSNDGDCGPWEEDLDDLDPALKAYCFSGTATNVMSDVIEGKEAFHIVKVKSRYVPTQKAREEDGEVSSVEVKHLQIDKWLLDPEFTREMAVKFITDKKIAFDLSELQDDLRKRAKIECVLPLYDVRRRKPRNYIVK